VIVAGAWSTIPALTSLGYRLAGSLRPLAVLVAAAVVVAACSPEATRPASTLLVAGATSTPPDAGPTAPEQTFEAEPTAPEATLEAEPSPSIDPGPTETPLDPEASGEPTMPTAIVPGSVDRSSLDVSATYRVNAAITVGTGALDVWTRIVATNVSGDGIDRLELNTVAARLGALRITTSTVDDRSVDVKVDDQTLIVPLGGVLPDGETATVTIAYRATLRKGLLDGDWMFTRSGGTLALYRWIPWISRAVPFDHLNGGEPFITQSSPQVDVEILSDAPLVLAAPAPEVDTYAAGTGTDWSFSVQNVRDVSVVLAPNFQVAKGKAKGIPITAYTRPGGLSGSQLVHLAAAAITNETDLLGVDFPWTTLTVVQTAGGLGIASPGLLWIPRNLDLLNRTYAVHHEVANQWFSGLVGNDQQAEPFADEAPADLLARTSLGTLRASRCPTAPLDRPITSYSKACYYEVVFVQGGRLLDDVRQRMGTKAFWATLGTYLESNRYRLGGTRQLLEALRAASPTDILPLIRPRFPSLY
jgi:hypothetical protein